MKTFSAEQYDVWSGEIPPIEPWRSDYAEFEANYLAHAGGYDFHHQAVLQNVPPPTPILDHPIRPSSLDRPERVTASMKLRDELLQQILALGDPGGDAPDAFGKGDRRVSNASAERAVRRAA